MWACDLLNVVRSKLGANMANLPIGDEARRVLKVVSSRASTGFAVMSKTGLQEDELVKAVSELQQHDLIEVKGGTPNDLGDAYIYVPPAARQKSLFVARIG
jgi:hypothetical protein